VIEIDVASAVWSFLEPLPLLWRLHQLYRARAFPIRRLLDYLPPARGDGQPVTVLDLGCGQGVFLALAKQLRPDVELIGLDLSESKIESARKAFAAAHIPVKELAVRDVAEMPPHSADFISILDVLYLVPLDKWERVLQRCFSCLKPGGTLVLKEMNPAVRAKFLLLLFEETLAVRVLGLTLGSKFTFPDRSHVRALLERVGFAVNEVPLDSGYYAPHHLWVGAKPVG